MTEDDFNKSLIEKVFIGAIATVVSAFVMNAYNQHAKAFEGAQVQLRSVSATATEAKTEILKSLGAAKAAASVRLENPDLKAPPNDQILTQINNVHAQSFVLRARMPDSADLAGELGKNLFAEYYQPVLDGTFVNVAGLNKKHDDAAAKQVLFLEKFDSELVRLISKEYNKAYDGYYRLARWYQSPACLATIAMFLSLVTIGLYKLTRPSA